MTTLEMIDSVSFIEDGINAARVVALASDGIIPDENKNDTIEWIFDRLLDSTIALRAELTAKLAMEKEKKKVVNIDQK